MTPVKCIQGYVEQLAHEKGRDKDLALYNKIEHMAPQLIAEERKIFKGVSPNVDFYSGFVYDMLGIPMELYTPLFAVARIMGWSATASKSCSAPTRSSVRPTRAWAAPTTTSRGMHDNRRAVP